MPHKIRLLQLIDRLGFAGAEGLLNTFAAGVDRSGFDLHIFSLRPGQPEVAASLRDLGLPVTELNQRSAYQLS